MQRDADDRRAEITNQVFFDNVYVGDDYRVGELNRGFQYISEALDLERFTMFTFSPIEERVELSARVRRERGARRPAAARRPGHPRSGSRGSLTETEVARVLGPALRREVDEGWGRADRRGVEYKLYATQLSQRVANASLDIGGADGAAAHRRGGRADAGDGRTRAIAARWSRPSAAARRRSRRTSSRGASSGSRATSERAVSCATSPRGLPRARLLERRAGFALLAHPRGLRRRRDQGRTAAAQRLGADPAAVPQLRRGSGSCGDCRSI